MTVQEKLDRLANMKREIAEIEEDIRCGKQLELTEFLNDTVGNYVRFKFDETDDVFLMADERRGGSVKGRGIVFYSNDGYETVENQFFIVDVDSGFKILDEDAWKIIINNRIMSYITNLFK